MGSPPEEAEELSESVAGLPMVASGGGEFLSTRWSVVLRAGDLEKDEESRRAMEHLCEAYWYPLYVFVRRSGKSVEDAQDLTQGLFAKLLDGGGLSGADPERGRFRSYLLRAMKNFMSSEWRRDTAQKRGGGAVTFSLDAEDAEGRYQHEPAGGELSPEALFDRRWARAVLEQVFEKLRDEFRRSGKEARYEALKGQLLSDAEAGEYERLAGELEMSESGVRTQVHRMRARFGQLMREEIAETVAEAGQVDEELSYLLESLS